MLTKHVEYLLYRAALLAARVKLAVRVGSCTTLAKAIVTFAIHLLRFGDECQVFLALAHVLATFQYNGAVAQLDELQGSKQSAGPLAHHDNGRSAGHIMILSGLKSLIFWLFVHIHSHLQVHVNGALPGIYRPFEHPDMLDGAHVDAFLTTHILCDAFLVKALLRQHTQLIFIYHNYLFCGKSNHFRRKTLLIVGFLCTFALKFCFSPIVWGVA